MSEEEKHDENSDGQYQYLFTIFEQSWEYIRHAQTTFWQSFTALFTVIVAILFYSHDKSLGIQIAGILFSLLLALVGFFVVARIINVLREHFTVINRIRKYCGIDEIKDIDKKGKYIIPERWRKTYELGGFDVHNRSETKYIVMVNRIYICIFALLVGYLAFLLSFGLMSYLALSYLALPIALICAAISTTLPFYFLGKYAREKVYVETEEE